MMGIYRLRVQCPYSSADQVELRDKYIKLGLITPNLHTKLNERPEKIKHVVPVLYRDTHLTLRPFISVRITPK
jgi:hypothetical protein